MNTFVFLLTSLIFFIAKPMNCYSYIANYIVAYTFMIMAVLSFLNYVESKINQR